MFTVTYNSETYILKVYESAYQNDLFPTEVKARIKLGNAQHVVQMLGVVTHDSSIDKERYVQGILLEHCTKGDLKSLLKKSDRSIKSSRKKRWAAQIAHGILKIHQTGLLHGHLRCQNVVVDHCDNAQLIDITDGT